MQLAESVQSIVTLWSSGMSVDRIADLTGRTAITVRRVLKEHTQRLETLEHRELLRSRQ